ncbi:MAG TPA: hypothetical protein VKA21_14330 [Candidatus Binatia bacterium]|nr:hypothetical protein [Candidatus Binatia bacterium]
MSQEAFPVSRCADCGRDVLTHVDGDDARRCVHCDADIDPAEVRWVAESELDALGYALHDDVAGCGRPGCGRGNCANRQ